MRTITTVAAVRQFVRSLRCGGRRVALVPTMGALHEGHMELVRQAARVADAVIVSVFVNPTQFGPGEDYERYPRPIESDLAMLREGDVAGVFIPAAEEMYPPDTSAGVRLAIDGLAEHLCGRFRPGHFDGVVQIVAKLFTAIEPDVAVFGRKDAQQFVIIEHLVRALGLGIEVIGVETVREPDGLAMSSRNRYLDPDERREAVVLSRALEAARGRIAMGEQARDALVTAMLDELGRAPAFAVQYAELVDAQTLQPIPRVSPGQEVLLAVAGHIGSTRLIDSAFITAPQSHSR